MKSLKNKVKFLATVTPEVKTYAEVLEVPTVIRQIMQEAKNDEKVEEREKERRSKNFIIHGAEEIGGRIEEIKAKDIEFIGTILEKIGIESQPENITRLGKPNEGKMRTMKIVMKSKNDKDIVMASLKRLKDTENELGKISITDDYTNGGRDLIKNLG